MLTRHETHTALLSYPLCYLPKIMTTKCFEDVIVPIFILITKNFKRCLTLFKSHEVIFNRMIGNQLLKELSFGKWALRIFKPSHESIFFAIIWIKDISRIDLEKLLVEAGGWNQLHFFISIAHIINIAGFRNKINGLLKKRPLKSLSFYSTSMVKPFDSG